MVETMVSICAATGKRKFFSKWDATLVTPETNPRSPLHRMAAHGQRAYECDECGYWHRGSARDVEA